MPVIIGILGGIGSGKSTVARMFENLGAARIDADEIAHQVREEPEIVARIKDTWGDQILTDGTVDRRKLSNIVFTCREELDRLNAIIHPQVMLLIETALDEIKTDSDVKAVVLDAPLLVETGFSPACDVFVYVDTDVQTRRKRVLARKHLSQSDMTSREKFQISLDKKRQMSHHVINNNSSEDLTFQQVSEIWVNLLS